jgi:hypothetical protein
MQREAAAALQEQRRLEEEHRRKLEQEKRALEEEIKQQEAAAAYAKEALAFQAVAAHGVTDNSDHVANLVTDFATWEGHDDFWDDDGQSE